MTSRGSTTSKIPRLISSSASPRARGQSQSTGANTIASPFTLQQISAVSQLPNPAENANVNENRDSHTSTILELTKLTVDDLLEEAERESVVFLTDYDVKETQPLSQRQGQTVMHDETLDFSTEAAQNSKMSQVGKNSGFNQAAPQINKSDWSAEKRKKESRCFDDSKEQKYALDSSACGESKHEIIQFHTPIQTDISDTDNEMDVNEWSQHVVFERHELNSNNTKTSRKKTKTIFSVDTPLDQVQVESGPGEHGDGCGVHSPQTKSKSASSANIRHMAFVENEDRQDEFEGMLKKVQCRAIVSKNLILQRDNTASLVDEYRKLIPIHNPTASLYAFKVCSRDCFAFNFTVSPDIGLLRPGSSIWIEIRAKSSINTTEMAVDDKIEINIFPVSCSDNDPDKLNAFYQNLSVQCPSLIYKQNVEQIVLLDNGNLKKNMQILNSIQDEKERKRLKDELHSFQIGSSVPNNIHENESNITLLRTINEQLAITNSHLRETFKEIIFFRNTYKVKFFICGIILMSYILFGSTRVEQSPPSASTEISTYEKILKGLYLR